MKPQRQEIASLKIAFGCIVAMMILAAMQFTTLTDYKETYDYQTARTLQLLTDSVKCSKTISKLSKWHYLLDDNDRKAINEQIKFEKELRIK